MNININSIITIQKYVRGFFTRREILVPSSEYQTKIWRQNRNWYKNGKSNECEKYQISQINKITNINLIKTYDRLNIETKQICNVCFPFKTIDGFELTENFDRKYKNDTNTMYFNLKFVCDKGGAQTRTLREVYHFIRYQIEYIQLNKLSNVYFINILDGNTSCDYMKNFNYLLNKPEYDYVSSHRELFK